MTLQNPNFFTRNFREKSETIREDLARWRGEVEGDITLEEKIDTLEAKRQTVDEKLDAWEAAEGERRETLQEEIQAAWDDLKATHDDLLTDQEASSQRPTSELLKGTTSSKMAGGDSI